MKKLILFLLISTCCRAQGVVVQTAYMQVVEDIFVTNPTFAAPNTQGNLLLCFFSAGVDNWTPAQSAGIHDSAGNIWTQVVTNPRFPGVNPVGYFEVWYAIANNFGGINTVAPHNFGGIPSFIEMYVLEISGVNQVTHFGYNIGSGNVASSIVNAITINAQASVTLSGWDAYAVELTNSGANPFYIGFFDSQQSITNNFTLGTGQVDFFPIANHNLSCVFGPGVVASKTKHKVYID